MNGVSIDTTAVKFSSATYSVEENQGFLQLELLIVNPLSIDFTVDIVSNDHSATSEFVCTCYKL